MNKIESKIEKDCENCKHTFVSILTSPCLNVLSIVIGKVRNKQMKNLEGFIKGCQIFLKYGNVDFPFSAGHDIIWVLDISPENVSQSDKDELEIYGFTHDNQGFYYYT